MHILLNSRISMRVHLRDCSLSLTFYIFSAGDFFFFLAVLGGLWDPSSQTKDQTGALSSESVES